MTCNLLLVLCHSNTILCHPELAFGMQLTRHLFILIVFRWCWFVIWPMWTLLCWFILISKFSFLANENVIQFDWKYLPFNNNIWSDFFFSFFFYSNGRRSTDNTNSKLHCIICVAFCLFYLLVFMYSIKMSRWETKHTPMRYCSWVEFSEFTGI